MQFLIINQNQIFWAFLFILWNIYSLELLLVLSPY